MQDILGLRRQCEQTEFARGLAFIYASKRVEEKNKQKIRKCGKIGCTTSKVTKTMMDPCHASSRGRTQVRIKDLKKQGRIIQNGSCEQEIRGKAVIIKRVNRQDSTGNKYSNKGLTLKYTQGGKRVSVCVCIQSEL